MLMGIGNPSYIDAALYNSVMCSVCEEIKCYDYKPNQDMHIVVSDEEGHEFTHISMDKFMSESISFLNTIKGTNQRAFTVPNAECFMGKIGCTKLKSQSRDKADIHIVTHDLRTNIAPLLGFSIKSQLGSDSTLLNATRATNFTYKIEGKNMTDSELEEINSIKDHLPRMQALIDKGYSLKYFDVEHPTFKNNLLFLDTYMPDFIASCLICDNLPNSTSSIKDAVTKVANENPFGFSGQNVLAFYEHKMKVLLLDSALGMTAAKEWNGRYDANGGYLVIKKNSDIICYHFYNRNDVEDYLFNNTRFERGSRDRHGFGSLYRKEDGSVYLKLNLQIRFTK